MSEPIQSISNGTYMIGETTQTELQAGPGISITKPSEGTVRIANDETVLFESANGVDGNNLPSNMEDMHNFEYIRLVLAGNSTLTGGYDKVTAIYDSSTNYFQMTYVMLSAQLGYVVLKNNFTSIAFKGSYTAIGNTSYIDNKGSIRLYKVVGINRINGGNA